MTNEQLVSKVCDYVQVRRILMVHLLGTIVHQ